MTRKDRCTKNQKLVISGLVLFFFIFAPLHPPLFSAQLVQQPIQPASETKVESFIDPIYSFTNPIAYFSLSQNGKKVVIQSIGLESNSSYIHVANTIGTNLQEVFSPGYYDVAKKRIYFTSTDQIPSISGDGRYVCVGVQNKEVNTEKKLDYVLVYDIQTKNRHFFPLRILIPGTNQAIFAPALLGVPNLDISSNGDYICAQIETGWKENQKIWKETALIVMDRNGANQAVIAGPQEFSKITHKFIYRTTSHSPHQPRFADAGRIVFYAQIFESTTPYDLKGELFVCDIRGNFLRQLTSSRRFDPKPEELGPFVLNMYGTVAYFKMHVENTPYLVSVPTVGGPVKSYFPMDPTTHFCISGDGYRIFYLDTQNNSSLVFLKISSTPFQKQYVIDKTNTGLPVRENPYTTLTNHSLMNASRMDFNGVEMLYLINSNVLVHINLLKDFESPRQLEIIFQKNRSVVFVNQQPVSISTPPYMDQNRIMVPMSIITKYFGMQYFPNLTKGLLQVQYNGNYYQFYMGKDYFLLNGEKKAIAPIILYKNEPFFRGGNIPAIFSFVIEWKSREEQLIVRRGT